MCMHVRLCLALCTPRTAVCQDLLSTEFSRQEYWIGSPFPTPGDLPKPGIESMFPALAGRFFTTAPPRKRMIMYTYIYICMLCMICLYVCRCICIYSISWTENLGGLQSTGVQRIRHHWATKHSQIYVLDYIILTFLCHSWSWCTCTWEWGTGLLEVFSQGYCPTPSVSHSAVSSSLWSRGLSMGFSRQEYWSGLPFPSPGKSSWPRHWTQVSWIAGRFFPIWATMEASSRLSLWACVSEVCAPFLPLIGIC